MLDRIIFFLLGISLAWMNPIVLNNNFKVLSPSCPTPSIVIYWGSYLVEQCGFFNTRTICYHVATWLCACLMVITSLKITCQAHFSRILFAKVTHTWDLSNSSVLMTYFMVSPEYIVWTSSLLHYVSRKIKVAHIHAHLRMHTHRCVCVHAYRELKGLFDKVV